jgi:hypothetical protein
MLIKAYIDKIIRGLNPKCNKVKDYMTAIEEQFVSSDKALANTFMDKLSMIKHHKSRNVYGHIMDMRDVVAQLKSLKVDIFESFLIYLILNTFFLQSMDYSRFLITYIKRNDMLMIF